ncbi:hypothetical protein AKJ09_08444 [Labilithrix luteola]|uniref:Uncharacterized protein n=1 Tax=Labilithrix luteola TaxID=1391654 RepID=A0A0K1Q7J4_9BACT|nr:hypothetical protein AKJ09_08444 [Labilithrix luteola]
MLRKFFKKVNGLNEQGYTVQRVTRANPRPSLPSAPSPLPRPRYESS